jgi:hypothetical protein
MLTVLFDCFLEHVETQKKKLKDGKIPFEDPRTSRRPFEEAARRVLVQNDA